MADVLFSKNDKPNMIASVLKTIVPLQNSEVVAFAILAYIANYMSIHYLFYLGVDDGNMIQKSEISI